MNGDSSRADPGDQVRKMMMSDSDSSEMEKMDEDEDLMGNLGRQ